MKYETKVYMVLTAGILSLFITLGMFFWALMYAQPAKAWDVVYHNQCKDIEVENSDLANVWQECSVQGHTCIIAMSDRMLPDGGRGMTMHCFEKKQFNPVPVEKPQ